MKAWPAQASGHPPGSRRNIADAVGEASESRARGSCTGGERRLTDRPAVERGPRRDGPDRVAGAAGSQRFALVVGLGLSDAT